MYRDQQHNSLIHNITASTYATTQGKRGFFSNVDIHITDISDYAVMLLRR